MTLVKKILFYTDTPLLGGAENQMLLLARFLPRDRYETTLVCASHKNLNPWCQDFMEAGIKVQRLKVFHKHDPRHFLYLKRLLPNFDLLHLHVWNPASCRYAFLAASKTPIVITEHDPFPLTGLKGWMKNKLMQRVSKIIVCSEAAKKLVLLQNQGDERIKVIPNGIDVEAWKETSKLPNRHEFRRVHFEATMRDKIILCVAELHERKGQKHLIKAALGLQNTQFDFKLVFVGEGPERKYYEKLARPLGEKVLFLGQRKEIAQMMAAADLFVLPSIREAFGLVLLEAAIAGVPVIATNVGGIPEIIQSNKTGLLVEPENAKALENAIKTLFQNPALAVSMMNEAKSHAEIKFGAKMMAARTAEVYEESLK